MNFSREISTRASRSMRSYMGSYLRSFQKVRKRWAVSSGVAGGFERSGPELPQETARRVKAARANVTGRMIAIAFYFSNAVKRAEMRGAGPPGILSRNYAHAHARLVWRRNLVGWW